MRVYVVCAGWGGDRPDAIHAPPFYHAAEREMRRVWGPFCKEVREVCRQWGVGWGRGGSVGKRCAKCVGAW